MGWDLKEKAKGHIVLGLFALITLLLLAIWKAIPASVWDKVSEVTPKRLLWALLALEALAIAGLVASILDNRRKRKHTLPALSEPPLPPAKPIRRFGVHWDTEANPLCPACDVLLPMIDTGTYRDGSKWEILKCPKCKTQFTLRGDDGAPVMLAKARFLIENGL